MRFYASRTSLDYACACALALKQAKLQSTAMEHCRIRGKVNASLKQGLETNREKKITRDLLRSKRASIVAEHEIKTRKNENEPEGSRHGQDHAEISIEHAEVSEDAKNANEHVQIKALHENARETLARKDSDELEQNTCFSKKRKRSKQFKNVSFNERKKIKTRCIQLLSAL